MSQGDKLGKYEVIRQIAAGGMAELYLARTVGMEGFEKLVCVKRILPEHADNPSFVNMFLNEARLAATLHHPNVAQVYDIGQESGECFFAMEYVHGEDLGRLSAAARENGVPISLDCALTLASGLCAGLHHAHEKASPDGKPLGVVHRDVSPTNVLVGYDGAVKLVDFGIARAGGEPTTSPNGLKGRAAYMSPEQCRGNAVLDRRSDLFSVGAILYELTTGRPPFQADSEHAVLEQIVSRDPEPPSKLVPAYPLALEAIVLRALARDVHSRFGTALELQNQLEDYAHENRLRVSPLVLARLMSTLFPARLEEWDHARAQGAFFVEQHVVRTLIESGKTPRGMARDGSQDEFGAAAFTETGMVAPWDVPPLADPTGVSAAAPKARHPSPSVARHPSPDVVTSSGLPTLRLPTPVSVPVPIGMGAVPSGGLSPRHASMPVPNMPGAVPIVTPMMGPPVASAGTLVSSALQAGGASVPMAKTPAPLGPMQAGMFVPSASRDFGGPGEASRFRAGHAANGAAALEAPMANHRSAASARPTMIVRTQQRSWLPVIAVAGAGAVGAIALWIIMNGNQAGTAATPQGPAAVAAPAGSPNAAGGSPTPAPAADRPAAPAGEAAPAKAAAVEPASAAKVDPATPPAAAQPSSATAAAPGRGSPSVAADAPGRDAATAAAPGSETAQRPAAAMLSSSPEDAKPETAKKRTAKFAPDPRGKPVRPKTRLDAKRADPRRAGKAEPKEPSWNDESPFLPVQTPKR